MSQKQNSGKVQIILALIGLIGTVLVGAFANWDRIFPPSPKEVTIQVVDEKPEVRKPKTLINDTKQDTDQSKIKEKISKGFVKDTDGNEYETISFDGKTILADNLRVNLADETKSKQHTNDNNSKNYGPYYTWRAAAEACQQLEGGTWRLPHKSEWDAIAAKYSISDLNRMGLNLKLGGYYDTSPKYKADPFKNIGLQGHWWSSSSIGNGDGTEVISYYYDNDPLLKKNGPHLEKRYYMNCRCIKIK